MRAGWGLWVVLCVGCQGAAVENPAADAGASDSATDGSIVPDGAAVDSGSSSDADAGAAEASLDGAPVTGCTALHGSSMVSLGDFCIDRYETTNEDYNAFLAAPAAERPNVEGCSWNTEFGVAVVDPLMKKRPRVRVDWCDAAAYCAWAGKRLCGEKATGKGAKWELFSEPGASEWMYACSANGKQTYGYAGTYDETRCQTGTGGIRDVGSRPDCRGGTAPFDQVFDLTGNVSEWDGTCQSFPPSKDTLCRGRGGSTGDGEVFARCAYGSAVGAAGSVYDGQGIRCCKTP